ncbi:hypothetical protein JW960_15920 [candidate division KSB1 bacterium]|nr:hypothetical protein [candidate division KSB1 bacterium]
MKKTFLFLFIAAVNTTMLYAQGIQQRSWVDGDSTDFQKYSSSQGVMVDESIRLIPQTDVYTPDSTRYFLYGEDRLWPIQTFAISGAYDIDLVEEKNKRFYLISDGLGRKVFEVNFTDPNNPIYPPVFTFTGQVLPLINPVDASAFYRGDDRKVLITDNGSNRVILVDRLGQNEEWAYGDGTAGRGQNQLNSPADAVALPDTNLFLIADQGNDRVIQVSQATNTVVWSYGEVDMLDPVDVELDTQRNSALITDRSNHRIILVNFTTHDIVWQFGTGQPGNTLTTLNLPVDADLLPNGDVLIADTGNKRLLQVDPSGNVVWKFDHRLLESLRDADRLPDNRTLIIGNYENVLQHIPIWLGYKDSLFVSEWAYLGQRVNFETLEWDAEVPTGTRLKLQIRSADNAVDLLDSPWYGPTDADSFYTVSGTPVNQNHHQGHSYFQFRAYLETDTPLQTPSLTNVRLHYQYYDRSQSGTLTSDIITDSSGVIISTWKTLNYETSQFEARNIKIDILNASTGGVLKTLYAENIGTVQNPISLSSFEELKSIQAIRLRATLNTSLSYRTPELLNWGIEWTSTQSTISQILFLNADDEAATYYRATPDNPPKEPFVDQAIVRLVDQNLTTVQNLITLKINALKSHDVLDTPLTLRPEGWFQNTGIPLVIAGSEVPGNTVLEVQDRDTLVISYTDPTNPLDVNVDSVFIIQNSVGHLNIVDHTDTPVDTMSIGDSLFVRITGERDHNITRLQDTIWVDVLNNKTGDKELIPLIELADSAANFATGHFISMVGLPIVLSSAGILDDGKIQTLSGNKINVSHVDNVTLQDILEIRQLPNIDTSRAVPQGLIDFDVAPNPFYVHRFDRIKMRASSAVSNLYVKRIEIYNLAGARVREINGSTVSFDLAQPIPRGTFANTETWWDLRNDNGNFVNSGTYWIKMIGSITTSTGGSSGDVSTMRKVIIIR